MNNLFDFATKELSQDAFICYLLNFVHEDNIGEDKELQNCAIDFLEKITEKNPIKENILVTDIKRQHHHIDILVEVNKKFHILIEDKVYTYQKIKQIENYKNKLKKEGKNNIITVYYKMIGQDRPEQVDVNIGRKDMIEILKPYINKTKNTIIKNYYEYISYIDSEFNLFKSAPIDDWSHNAYRGFYEFLTKEDAEVINTDGIWGWKYVSNPSGGFIGLWWFFIEGKDLINTGLQYEGVTAIHLQIEKNKITLKVQSEIPLKNNVKWDIFNTIIKDCNIPDFKKPKRFGYGKTVTIGYIEYDENNYLERINIMEELMQDIQNGKFTV
ncbi:PD-(D/E)XK nuclease family protein [Alkalibacterium putridalgicola]|uniref:PD-(D/E)XK nuclease family protein n=1 Tax=Alkalibacterium putridalgicola TaxID=426703 RepID=UPI0034CF19C7